MDDATAVLAIAAGVCFFAAEWARSRGRPWSGALAAYGDGLFTAFSTALAIFAIEHQRGPWADFLSLVALGTWFFSVRNIIRNPTDPHRRSPG